MDKTQTRNRYNFGIDRTVDGYIYRFKRFYIQRCPADSVAKHFQDWQNFTYESECIHAWRDLCDQAAVEQEVK